MKKLLLFVFLLFSVTSISCAKLGALVEQGTITFVDPAPKSIFNQDFNNQPLLVSVTLDSTYYTDKLVILSTDGSQWSCLVKANTKTICPPAHITQPGQITITVDTLKSDGITRVTSSTQFNWTPYSKLDKAMGNIALSLGSDNPVNGYILVGFFVMIFTIVVLAKIVPQWGAVLGLFIGLIGLALFFNQSGASGPALVVVHGIYGLLGISVVAFVVFAAIRSGYSVSGPHTTRHSGMLASGETYDHSQTYAGYIGPSHNQPKPPPFGIPRNDQPLLTAEERYLLDNSKDTDGLDYIE